MSHVSLSFAHLRRKPRLSSCGGMRRGCRLKPWRGRTRFGGFRLRYKGTTAVKLWGSTQSPLPMCDLDFPDSEGVYLRHLTEALI